ncbi:hypothetical protein EV178_001096, partial [Coemansia sp. RSA 1646]
MDNEDTSDTGTRVIKCPLKSLANDRNGVTKVNDYVVVANTASAHMYGLARWIFVHELATHKQFDPSVYLEKRFFGEIFLHLTKRKARLNVKAEIQEYRRVIRKYLDAYKEAAGITEFDIASPNQTAQFEAVRIYTAYVNNIQTKFGQYLRHAANVLLKTRERKRDLEKAMKGRTMDEIKEAYEDQIWKPGRELKEAIKHRNTVLPIITVGDRNIGDMLEPVLTAYDSNYKLEEEGIYYDIKAHPKKHFKAFYRLAVLLETNDSEKKSGEFTYIHELSPEQLANMENPIFVDPGRQDLAFGMTLESTSEEKALFRYTRSQKAKETRTTRYRKLREKVKKEHPDSNEIKATEARLAAFSCTSIFPGKYEQYVRTRAAVWPVL